MYEILLNNTVVVRVLVTRNVFSCTLDDESSVTCTIDMCLSKFDAPSVPREHGDVTSRSAF